MSFFPKNTMLILYVFLSFCVCNHKLLITITKLTRKIKMMDLRKTLEF